MEVSLKLMVVLNIFIVMIIPEKTVQCKAFTDTLYKVFFEYDLKLVSCKSHHPPSTFCNCIHCLLKEGPKLAS